VHFNLLHDKDGERVHYKRVCDKGHEVDWDEIVRGYPTSKQEYVVFTDEELESLAIDSSKEVDVSAFVPLDQIDPMYFDRTYYVAPEEHGVKAYKLLTYALETTGKVGVATVTLRDKEHLACLRLRDEVMVIETMRWPDEIRDIKIEELRKRPKLSNQEKRMAKDLVEQLSGDFDPSEFTDEYRKAVQKAAKKKAEGGKIVAPAEEEPKAEVVDIMEALKASVEEAKGRGKGSSKSKSSRKKTSRRSKAS
jgi:DNA end-binding protein Ku